MHLFLHGLRVVLLFFILLSTLCPTPAFAEKAPRELTGLEWTKMVRDEKTDFVNSMIRYYKEQGVTVTRPASFYVYSLDAAVLSDNANESQNVADTLNLILYANEPSVQDAADGAPTIKKIEMH